MRKHVDLFTLIALVIALAALAGAWRGIAAPVRMFGFSSGG